MRFLKYRNSFKEVSKTSKNSCRVALIALICLSTLFSAFYLEVQLTNAQNNGNNATGILPALTPEQTQQLAANGTSFDLAFKHRIDAMKAAKIPVNYTSFVPPLKGINLCLSPMGKAFGQTICDFGMAMVYELCQAIPDQLSYICTMPSINNYLKDRNMVDGQTDKLAWQFLLHSKEITANPYESTNSTGPTTNSTAIGQAQEGAPIQILKVLSQNAFVDTNPYTPRMHIVGEIQNNGTQVVQGVGASVTLYDSNNQVIGVGSAYANIGVIRPGQVTPFEVVIDPYSVKGGDLRIVHHYYLQPTRSSP